MIKREGEGEKGNWLLARNSLAHYRERPLKREKERMGGEA